MKKLLISTFAAAVMLLFGGVTEVNGDPLTYEVVGDTVSVVKCDNKASGELVIPSSYEGKPITSIGEQAFRNCSDLTSVTIPDSVISIGAYALSNCIRLANVSTGNGVIRIGERAFEGCSRLTSITVPNSVSPAFLLGPDAKVKSKFKRTGMPLGIGKDAFKDCSSLTSVTVPCLFFQFFETNRVIKFGFKELFSDSISKGNLRKVTITERAISIPKYAFRDCSSLTSVTIGKSVTSIGDSAFEGCSRLAGITIPNNVVNIGRGYLNWSV